MPQHSTKVEQLHKLLEEAAFTREGIRGEDALQKDILSLADAYLDMVSMQSETRRQYEAAKLDCNQDEMALKNEHLHRIKAHLAEWNRRSVEVLSQHADAMDRYACYLRSAGECLSEDRQRIDAAEAITGSIISRVLSAEGLQKCERDWTVPDEFDSESYYSELICYQRMILKPTKCK